MPTNKVPSTALADWTAAEKTRRLAALADASLSLADPVGYMEVNAVGTLNVLEAARQHGAGVVFASSQRVYEPWHGPLREDGPTVPTTVYGCSTLDLRRTGVGSRSVPTSPPLPMAAS